MAPIPPLSLSNPPSGGRLPTPQPPPPQHSLTVLCSPVLSIWGSPRLPGTSPRPSPFPWQRHAPSHLRHLPAAPGGSSPHGKGWPRRRPRPLRPGSCPWVPARVSPLSGARAAAREGPDDRPPLGWPRRCLIAAAVATPHGTPHSVQLSVCRLAFSSRQPGPALESPQDIASPSPGGGASRRSGEQPTTRQSYYFRLTRGDLSPAESSFSGA